MVSMHLVPDNIAGGARHRGRPLPSTRWWRVLALLVASGLIAAACGGGGEKRAATTTTAEATTAPSGSRLTVEVKALIGSKGLMLVASLFEGGGGPGQGGAQAGTVCAPIDGDPWSGGGVMSTAAVGNPCDHKPPKGVVVSKDGTYSYLVGTYTPGRSTPERCATGQVAIRGNTRMTVPGTDLVSNCAPS